jgi:prepilin-type N-terminal cleavage/methylation domain-containing protein
MRDNKGFTLIELLIVVVIIGILAAIAIPKFSATREKAYFAAMKSDLKNLASQQEIYYADTYGYTTDVGLLGFTSSSGVSITIAAGNTGWSGIATHAALTATEGCAFYYGEAASVAIGSAAPVAGETQCTS